MTCDFCLYGILPIDGWHELPDPEGIEGTWRVPCPDNPPDRQPAELVEVTP